MKIYIGNLNIASLFNELRAGFEALGHEVFTMSSASSTIQHGSDFVVDKEFRERMAQFVQKFPHAPAEIQEKFAEDIRQKLYEYTFSKAMEADICIFLWESFNPLWKDLLFFRKSHIKTAVYFVGSEARVLPMENLWRKWVGSFPAVSAYADAETTLQLVRYAECNADAILGASQANLRPEYIPPCLMLDTTGIPYHVNADRDIPVILHAPSNQSTKGTAIWKNIFAELQAEGFQFTVRLVENVPHPQFLQLLQNVDIVCDGIIHGGKLLLEAMAGGCAVLSALGTDSGAYQRFFRMDDDTLRARWNVRPGSPEDEAITAQHMKKAWPYYPEENPCIPVTPGTAKDALRSLLMDRQRRLDLARRGRIAIDKYSSPAIVAADILQCLAEPQSFKTQTLLSFHHSLLYSDYEPSSPEEARIINGTTDIVRNCGWYKACRKPLRRAGLVF